MSWKRTRAGLPLILSLLLVLGVPGCWNPFNPDKERDKDPEPPPTYDRSSRVNLINFFAQAHKDRDLEDYELSLHGDYEFWFSQDDRDNPDWDWSDWIVKAIDVDITGRMFSAGEVIDIRMDLLNQTTVPGAQTPEDNFWPEDLVINEEIVTVYRAEFLVDMHVVEERPDDSVDHWVDGRANIFLIPDPQYEGLWQIWMIEDLGNEHKKGSEQISWGNLKRLHR